MLCALTLEGRRIHSCTGQSYGWLNHYRIFLRCLLILVCVSSQLTCGYHVRKPSTCHLHGTDTLRNEVAEKYHSHNRPAFCGLPTWPFNQRDAAHENRGTYLGRHFPSARGLDLRRANGWPHTSAEAWAIYATKELNPATKEDTECLSITEDERLKACYTLDTLFARCVSACESDDLSEAMSAIQDYIKGYDSLFSRFFEERAEVPLQNGNDETSASSGTFDSDSLNGTLADGGAGSSYPEEVSAASDKSLSFYYTVDDVEPDGRNRRRRWHVSVKAGVPQSVRKLIMQYRKRCMGIMSRAMHKVSSMEDLKIVTNVSREAARYGMTVMTAMYYAMSVIHAKYGRFNKALEYIERMWKHGERRRHRSYEPLLCHFEENLDSDGMVCVMRHMVDLGGLPVSGLMFTRVMMTLCLATRRQLMELSARDSNSQQESLSMDKNNAGRVSGQLSPTGAFEVPTTREEIYSNLKRHVQEVLNLYQKHACSKVSLSSRLGYVISSVFETVAPGLISLTHVSPYESSNGLANTANKAAISQGETDTTHQGRLIKALHSTSHGQCFSCGEKLHLLDLSPIDRFGVFRSWLQHIYDYNFPEVGRLANFYAWLHSSLAEGMPYTCILDGQNIGYHKRQLMNPLDLQKIDTVVHEMIMRGEHPLVVLPYYARVRRDETVAYDVVNPDTLKLLFPTTAMEEPIALSKMKPGRPMRFTTEEIAIVDRWCDMKQAYFCSSASYDDNYFFMANVMTGSAEELELMARFLKSSLELSLRKEGNKRVLDMLSQVPTPKVDDYFPVANRIAGWPLMITVTNDTFTNLEIPGVDEQLMRALRDIPLTPYFFTGGLNQGYVKGGNTRSGQGQRVLVGNRLKYSLEMSYDGKGKYHIPLGYERKVIDFKARHMVSIYKYEHPRIEPPLVGAYLEPPAATGQQYDHNIDQELKQTNSWLEKYGYNDILAALEDKCPKEEQRRWKNKGYVISTKTPEIIKQKFNPSQETRWLCVDLSVLDRLGSEE
ncbi:hypothetical protein BgAZ_200450 [Babesia gibsoni]|uniref:Uncharacterized protein n=1 Tax=Babesia gibsoni TaxID=33632 RepID=A0AAD8LLR1_BABGI|nr:hypothetical protein BgAZ_200450 [Babesia gibsoni]